MNTMQPPFRVVLAFAAALLAALLQPAGSQGVATGPSRPLPAQVRAMVTSMAGSPGQAHGCITNANGFGYCYGIYGQWIGLCE